MRIAIVSSNEQKAPPPPNTIIASMYVSSLIAEGLEKLGHTVFSIVGKGSGIHTEKVFSNTKPFFDTIKRKDWENLNDLRLMWQLIVPFETDLNLTLLDFLKDNPVDVIHFHSIIPFYGLPFAMRTNTPSLFTLHGTTTPLELHVIKQFLAKNIFFNSISHFQQKGYPGIHFADNVYNGIPASHLTFNPTGSEEMVIASRFKPEKGFEEAITAAVTTRKPLRIAGEIRVSEKEYFYHVLEPLITQHKQLIHYEKFVDHKKVNPFLGKGKVLLFPIQWEEPFGLIMVEAMASGTPAIAFARGAAPEVIADGITGFLVNPSDKDKRGNFIIKRTGMAGLCEAIERIYSLPEHEYLTMRKNARQRAMNSFSQEAMVNNYLSLYQKISQK